MVLREFRLPDGKQGFHSSGLFLQGQVSMPEVPRGTADETRFAAMGEKALLAGVPEEDRELVTGIWPFEFERILNGESASMLAQDAQLGKL